MCLDIINYLENVKLRADLERQSLQLAFVLNHPYRALARQLLHPIWNWTKRTRHHLRARRIASLTVANVPSGASLSEDAFALSEVDEIHNVYAIDFAGDSGVPLAAGLRQPSIRLPSGHSKLVIVHAFYEQEAAQIFERLGDFPDYDIVLTTNRPEIQAKFLQRFEARRAACVMVPNRGRDVLPFLLVVKALEISRYRHFVKVHTKRSRHLRDNGRWFHSNLDVLLGHKLMTDRIFDHVPAQSPSIYGVECLTLQDHLENNRHWMEHLLRARPDDVSGSFVPGTMFLGSGAFLQAVARMNLHLLKGEEEKGQLDGCLVHALERFFGYVAAQAGGECSTVEKLALERCTK